MPGGLLPPNTLYLSRHHNNPWRTTIVDRYPGAKGKLASYYVSQLHRKEALKITPSKIKTNQCFGLISLCESLTNYNTSLQAIQRKIFLASKLQASGLLIGGLKLNIIQMGGTTRWLYFPAAVRANLPLILKRIATFLAWIIDRSRHCCRDYSRYINGFLCSQASHQPDDSQHHERQESEPEQPSEKSAKRQHALAHHGRSAHMLKSAKRHHPRASLKKAARIQGLKAGGVEIAAPHESRAHQDCKNDQSQYDPDDPFPYFLHTLFLLFRSSGISWMCWIHGLWVGLTHPTPETPASIHGIPKNVLNTLIV